MLKFGQVFLRPTFPEFFLDQFHLVLRSPIVVLAGGPIVVASHKFPKCGTLRGINWKVICLALHSFKIIIVHSVAVLFLQNSWHCRSRGSGNILVVQQTKEIISRQAANYFKVNYHRAKAAEYCQISAKQVNVVNRLILLQYNIYIYTIPNLRRTL